MNFGRTFRGVRFLRMIFQIVLPRIFIDITAKIRVLHDIYIALTFRAAPTRTACTVFHGRVHGFTFFRRSAFILAARTILWSKSAGKHTQNAFSIMPIKVETSVA